MLNLPSTTAIFLHLAPTDLRKGFDGLSGLVRSEFNADPLDGSLFIFVNRKQDRMKILQWDGAGYWLYYRRLEVGTFEMVRGEGKCLQIDATQLVMILGGISIASAKRRKRYHHPASPTVSV